MAPIYMLPISGETGPQSAMESPGFGRDSPFLPPIPPPCYLYSIQVLPKATWDCRTWRLWVYRCLLAMGQPLHPHGLPS